MTTALDTATIKTLVAKLTGCPAANVRWTNEPEKFPAGLKYKIVLNQIARVAVGWDEYRYSYDSGTKTNTETIGGQRVSTISIRCESFTMTDPAFEVLERLRMGLNTRSTQATLKAAGLAYQDLTGISQIPNFSIDNREISVASCDLVIGHVATFTPPGGSTGDQPGWIERVSSKSAPLDPDAPAVDLDFTKIP